MRSTGCRGRSKRCCIRRSRTSTSTSSSGRDPTARSIRLELPRFTLVGATTRPGRLTLPLRERFGFSPRLDYYSAEDLAKIVMRSAGILIRARRRRRCRRDRPAFARHAAHRQPPAPAGSRLRRGPSRRFGHARGGGGRARGLRGGRPGPRPAGPLDPPDADRQVRRRARGALHARGLGRRGDRHRGGRRGAVPPAAGIPPADAPRAGGHGARVPPPGHSAPGTLPL